jgi:hypothetical protein
MGQTSHGTNQSWDKRARNGHIERHPLTGALAGLRQRTAWVVSSAVERLVYTEDVGGSKPSPPTSPLLEDTPLAPATGFPGATRLYACGSSLVRYSRPNKKAGGSET